MPDIAVQLSIGGKKVVSSGSLVLGSTTEFALEVSGLTLNIRFEDEGDDGSEAKVSSETNGKTQQSTIVLYNFGRFGPTTAEWEDLLTIDNKNYTLAVSSRRIKGSHLTYVVHYTLSEGSAVHG